MATPSDISRMAQIVALGRELGQTTSQIDARLFDFGVAPGSPERDQAYRLGDLAFNWGVQMALGNEPGAAAIRQKLADQGMDTLWVMAKTVYVTGNLQPGETPEPEDLAFRQVKQAFPITWTESQIKASILASEQAKQELMKSPPPPGGLYDIYWQFGAGE